MVKQSGHVLLISSSRNQLIRSSSKGSGGVNNLKMAIKACLALAITIWMIYQLKFSLNHDNPRAAVVGDDNDNTKIQTKTGMGTQTVTKKDMVNLGRKGMILTGDEMGSSGKSSSSNSKTGVDDGDQKSETENKGLVEEEKEQEEQIDELADGVEKDGDNDDDENDEEEEGDDEEDELETEQLDDTTEDENTNSQSSIENDLSD